LEIENSSKNKNDKNKNNIYGNPLWYFLKRQSNTISELFLPLIVSTNKSAALSKLKFW